MSDLDSETWASIERNNEQNARLERHQQAHSLPIEKIMTVETFYEHKRMADAIAKRLRDRLINCEAPRGER